MKIKGRALASALFFSAVCTVSQASAEVVKIAYIDALSGAFAPIGQSLFSHWKMMAEHANQNEWADKHTFEVVGFDNKGSPQESIMQLRAAADQGFRYITQGVGSGAALALSEAVNRHNQRNPGKEIVFLNFAANDPDLTNSKCNFWHFRLDANSDMKMEVLTSVLAEDENVKKVYLINQDFSLGHQVTRASKESLKRLRPDVEI